MKTKMIFTSRVMFSAKLSWRRAFESSRVMVSLFNRLILSLTDGLTKEWCIATFLFWKAAKRLGKKSGWLFMALYIKQARVALQKYSAGDKTPELTVYVSLTKSGLPRIIPSFHRRKIRGGDVRIIQLYMSLFSLSKLVELAAKVSTDTFTTITSPSNLVSIQRVAAEMRPHLRVLLSRYVPGIDRIPLKQGLRFVPTWKSTPSLPWYQRLLRKSGDEKGKSLRSLSFKSSCFHVLPYEMANFQFLMTFVHKNQDQFSQGCLWYPITRYAFDQVNKSITNWSLDWFERRIGPLIPSLDQLGVPPNTGRLCASLTGDGKRRLFAIGNYINQRLLAPVHQWLAAVLKRIPMDGTFNQTAPLDLLHGVAGTVHSVDLKAATDRWPLLLLFELVQSLFDRSFASSVVNSSLATNIFDVAFLRKRTSVSFVAGQPLGYYASWPLFALSHHVLVWWSAEQAYPGRLFTKYAILGDDVVIADDKVRDNYAGLLERLGVGISVAKSLTSPSGGCEFAKKFRLSRMTVDVSPVSLKKLLDTWTLPGWYQLVTTHSRSLRLSTHLRLAGLGFKAASRSVSSKSHGKRARRMIAMRLHALLNNLGVELKLGIIIGQTVTPNVVGRLIVFLFDYLKPKDMILPPAEAFAYPGMMDFNEYSLYRGWMEQYLSYLKWYTLLHMKSDLRLDDFLDPPVYIRTWFRPSTDESQFKFGIMFRLYDLALELSQQDIRSLPAYNVFYMH